mgnify:CR=1 FL=1
MSISIGVEHFGKIEKAEITLGNLLLFVGENNSGKTYMMQLLYGVTSEIIEHSDCLMEKYSRDDSKYLITPETILSWEKKINQYLKKEKEQIVREIFYRDIQIGELYMRIDHSELLSYEVEIQKGEMLQEVIQNVDFKNRYDIVIKRMENNIIEEQRRIGVGGDVDRDFVIKYIGQSVAADMLGMHSTKSALFFPASRTGMLLLYKYFFAEKDNTIHWMETNGEKHAENNHLGLSAPVYNFLQFLLRFTPNNLIRKKDQELLQFIESNLIDGSLQFSSEESYYIPTNSENRIPLYLSSSLINELAPIVKLLSNVYPYDNIYYDEIENCLHPLKQKAMARLIVRLVNSGRRMIVSTHSDSMAINLNNLLTLTLGDMSEAKRNEKISALGLENDDIIKTRDIHVYQFANSDNGTSNVTELEFRTINKLGYDFGLFSQNLQNLSDDTINIME